MHRLATIDEAEATRFLTLINTKTGTEDKCFDDSSLFSCVDFSFMQVGVEYDCKLALFGVFSGEESSQSVRVTLSEPRFVFGERSFIQVCRGDDEYYIPANELEDVDLDMTPYYCYTRKDIIQIDGVVHFWWRWNRISPFEDDFYARGVQRSDIASFVSRAIETPPTVEGATKDGRFAVHRVDDMRLFVIYRSDGELASCYPLPDRR